jgi:predicted nucleic-acid-binding protein
MTLPIALGTNLLVRLLTGDDPERARRVADLIDASPACFVPITVVLELEWVLRGAYRLERGAVIAALEGLMAIRQVHLEQEDLVRQALAWHQQGLDFADALHGLLHQLLDLGVLSRAESRRGIRYRQLLLAAWHQPTSATTAA